MEMIYLTRLCFLRISGGIVCVREKLLSAWNAGMAEVTLEKSVKHQFVMFETGVKQFGIDIAATDSIVKMQRIAAVPQAPSFVEGVTNLRGIVIPVIDLHERFGIMQTEG